MDNRNSDYGEHNEDELESEFGFSNDEYGFSDDVYGFSDDVYGFSDDVYGFSDDEYGFESNGSEVGNNEVNSNNALIEENNINIDKSVDKNNNGNENNEEMNIYEESEDEIHFEKKIISKKIYYTDNQGEVGSDKVNLNNALIEVNIINIDKSVDENNNENERNKDKENSEINDIQNLRISILDKKNIELLENFGIHMKDLEIDTMDGEDETMICIIEFKTFENKKFMILEPLSREEINNEFYDFLMKEEENLKKKENNKENEFKYNI